MIRASNNSRYDDNFQSSSVNQLQTMPPQHLNTAGPLQGSSVVQSTSFDGARLGNPPSDLGPGVSAGPSPLSDQGAGFPGPSGAYPLFSDVSGELQTNQPNSSFPANRAKYLHGRGGNRGLLTQEYPGSSPGKAAYILEAADPENASDSKGLAKIHRLNPNDERPIPTLQKSEKETEIDKQMLKPRKIHIDDRPLPALQRKNGAGSYPFGLEQEVIFNPFEYNGCSLSSNEMAEES